MTPRLHVQAWLARQRWAEALVTVAVGLRVEASLRRRNLPELASAAGIVVASGSHPVRPRGDADALLPRWAAERLDVVDSVMRNWPFGHPDRRCLRRALVMGHRLRRVDPAIRLGVRRTPAGLLAHAWLEFGDGWTLDADAAEFYPLPGPVAPPSGGPR